MGTYGIPPKELIEPLMVFLQDQSGDVTAEAFAEAIAIAWNKLSKKELWGDFLAIIDEFDNGDCECGKELRKITFPEGNEAIYCPKCLFNFKKRDD